METSFTSLNRLSEMCELVPSFVNDLKSIYVINRICLLEDYIVAFCCMENENTLHIPHVQWTLKNRRNYKMF